MNAKHWEGRKKPLSGLAASTRSPANVEGNQDQRELPPTPGYAPLVHSSGKGGNLGPRNAAPSSPQQKAAPSSRTPSPLPAFTMGKKWNRTAFKLQSLFFLVLYPRTLEKGWQSPLLSLGSPCLPLLSSGQSSGCSRAGGTEELDITALSGLGDSRGKRRQCTDFGMMQALPLYYTLCKMGIIIVSTSQDSYKSAENNA